jgi:hypothetical protein
MIGAMRRILRWLPFIIGPAAGLVTGMLIVAPAIAGPAVQRDSGDVATGHTIATTAYCARHSATEYLVRAYAYAPPAASHYFRSGAHGHGGRLLCIGLVVGDGTGPRYVKWIEFDPATGGWPIPLDGIDASYYNCGPPYQPPMRWSPTGLPYNDCAEEFASSEAGPWMYNGTVMVPAGSS